MNYEKLCQEFIEYKCLLLTTKKELQDQMRQRLIPLQHARVRILAACGHEHECVVTNYLRRRTAVMCKECRLKNIQSINKNRTLNCHEIEFMGFLKIREILEKNNLEIQKTKEGCRADFMIRPNDSKKDEWIGVQLKVCSSICFKMYSFRKICKPYDNLIMFCYCLEDNKLWIFPYYEIKELKNILNISVVSKYNKFLININDDIQSIINSFENNFKFYRKNNKLIYSKLIYFFRTRSVRPASPIDV